MKLAEAGNRVRPYIRQRTIRLLATLTILAFAAGCTSASHPHGRTASDTLQQPAGSVKLTPTDVGHTVRVRQGQELYVLLPPAPDRLGWQAPKTSTDAIRIATFRNPPAGGFSAVVAAAHPGRAQLVVSYDCPQGSCNGWGVFIVVS